MDSDGFLLMTEILGWFRYAKFNEHNEVMDPVDATPMLQVFAY